MSKRTKQKVATRWEPKTQIRDTTLEGDFSNTHFNEARFFNVVWRSCTFERTVVDGARAYPPSEFVDCTFRNVDFSHTTLLSNETRCVRCTFERCRFARTGFTKARFCACTFESSTFLRIDFNGTTFEDCRFASRFAEVTFNGIYDTNPDPTVCLQRVDFTGATFGDFVSFNNCDLTSCTPPQGRTFTDLLYPFYSDDDRTRTTGSKGRPQVCKREMDEIEEAARARMVLKVRTGRFE